MKVIESYQHRKTACLEKIAYLNAWVNHEDMLKVYEVPKKNQYREYFKDVQDGKYIDVMNRTIVLTTDWYLEHEDWMNNVTNSNYQKYYDVLYKDR